MTWQPAPDVSRAGTPGTLRRDAVSDAVRGRGGGTFTTLGRAPAPADGHGAVRVPVPGGVPCACVAVTCAWLCSRAGGERVFPPFT